MQSYLTVSTTIEFKSNIEIGKLIGREGCNLRTIASGTGTSIHAEKDEKNTEAIQIEIKDIKKSDSSGERINKAISKLVELEKKVRFSNNDNHQHLPPPRNQRYDDSKDRRKNFKQETSYNARQPRNNRPMHYN
ncbi:hypothetical protein RclHR1_15310001 [Rhizophagus clarus]|nr:hypothetical protein RclHR1_15310001 [Rhizophagus clarus]